MFKLALPKPQDERELPNAIKGLLAFTQEDGELFRKLGRDQELNSLNNFVKDPQIPLVVIMGDSGAGKSSLLRAGLSHSLKGTDSAYVYWEALPHNTVAGLLNAVNSELNTGTIRHTHIHRPETNNSASFDVFLSHNSQDKPIVRELAQALKALGLWVCLDEEQLVPGRPWQEALETIIKTTHASAVLIGENGIGPWETPEMRACLSELVDRKLPVIPVLLPNASAKPELPLFLKAFTWVDLRDGLTDQGLGKLVWGITGIKPEQTPKSMEDELHRLNTDLNVLLKLPQKAVIVLDQFEQLLPDNPEHKPVFELLQKACTTPPPHPVTWCVAFREEYGATWYKFVVKHRLTPPLLSLELFSVAQAQNVFITLAEAAGLSLEQDLVDGFMKTVSRKQRVSPVEIGIGLQMLNELAQSKQTPLLSLQDYNFAGGSQGLFVSFLNNALTQRFPEPAEREALYKVLLECVDLNRNQRIAEGKSVAQLAASSPGLPAEHLQYALDSFASGQMRILEKLPIDPPRYRLPHETMIPALRQLGGKILSEVAEAEFLLQTAYAAWQNSGNNRRYLLSGKELKKVRLFQQQLDLGDRATFLKQSTQQRQKMLAVVFAFIILTPFFAYYGYQSFLDDKYRNALADWGLPGDLMDYTGQLQSLSISDKNIRYLDWLANFKKLTTLTLNLRNSNITDLSALHQLKQLTTLTLALGNSDITDIKALHIPEQLTTLTLNFGYSKITDLNALQELTQLTTLTLDFPNTEITDLSVLQKLKQLTTLTLDSSTSRIIYFRDLQQLTQLTALTLDLSSSKITDLNALQELKKLTTLTLNLRNSNIADLSPLHELKKLTTLALDLGGSDITDLSPLHELKQLRTLILILGESNIKYLGDLHELKQLSKLNLNLYHLDTAELSALQELKQLSTLALNLSGSNIDDLSSLKSLKARQITLNIQNSEIKSIKGLPNLTGLTMGNLSL
ncbi:MAG: TIR domain-containing protein [Methylococcaceae bacterium]|jgi:nucleotide-binding universal stress UspA family protein